LYQITGDSLNFIREYNSAMLYQAYIETLGKNLDLHNLHYKKFSINKEIAAKISSFRNVNILVITEPWCGDSLALLPIIRKIAEVNGRWEIKILLRDANLEIIDQFLTKGIRGIPMFLFLDEKGEFLFKWGPRPKKAAQIFEIHRKHIQEGKINKPEVIKKIRIYYAKDRGISTLTELLQVFDEYGL
jgi:hypothetical protein